LNNLLTEHNVNILIGDINVDALSSNQNIFADVLQHFKLVVNRPTHLSGGLHVHIKQSYLAK